MKRIDRETVNKILDAANIVDVVSDFVSLKRRGANYTGLCPFHNERTPSFSVSPARGICKCFSCGKGGSPVGFVMEHEQMSYNEALRYLAKKYHIEIKEHDMTDEERQQETERESMFAVNEFALKKFEDNLLNTPDGRDIGLSYFRERGINDQAIARFHLGYSLERGNSLCEAAKAAGFSEKSIVDTGLCIRRDDGSLYDRFKGRVMFPVHTISGKVVAFGGRTLRNDKKVAKYVNSPESSIYSKSRELYGLYQAKRAIVEKQKCILVEGYMDVISMSQSGVENIVASSGTSLTEGQIRLIHRFTENVTVIYDSDPAGIKASLRGIDMLLAEGLNIKVVLLPEGDDPDSFAQSHSLTEIEAYLAEHEVDFIKFKTDILLQGAQNDPIRRSQVIIDIVESISMIPNEITRAVYIKECSRALEIGENAIIKQMNLSIARRREKQADKTRQSEAVATISTIEDVDVDVATSAGATPSTPPVRDYVVERANALLPYESEIMRYVVKYGLVTLQTLDENGDNKEIFVVDYIAEEMKYNELTFASETYRKIIGSVQAMLIDSYPTDRQAYESQSLKERDEEWRNGYLAIKSSAQTLKQIEQSEKDLREQIDINHIARMNDFAETYAMKRLVSSADDQVRNVSTELAQSRHQLSKMHTRYTRVETEVEKLTDLLPRALYGLKHAIISHDIADLQRDLRELFAADNNDPRIGEVMSRIASLETARKDYSKILGERVILPSKRR